jgi:uncharacterized protein (DUF58 family)
VSYGRSQLPDVLPAERGGRQLAKILEALALLQAKGELPISALVMAQAQHLPRGSTIVLITPSTHRHVPVTVDHLLRFGLRPVVVLLDAASFGGSPGTDKVATAIAGLGVMVFQVANGADLEVALSLETGMVGAAARWN